LLLTIGGPLFIAAADVSLEKAIELARTEAHRLGLDTTDMSFGADETNTRWRSYRPYTPDLDEFRQLDAKLYNRQFFAVYGAPNPRAGGAVFGGDIFVFIDRDSGNIIAVLP
jgi:hypothetical protein